MKKAIIATIAIIWLTTMSNFAYAKARRITSQKVTVCMSYLVGATFEMTCSGHFQGKTTIVKLYNAGWHYVGHIGGASQFILIFEK